mmetsp:Transcript_113928/g.316992  ORF Transcript_113928/g.316992 Transcript_113928/m.316992 type:complete len:246 (+) Transcript_113928:217-954(+)
MLASSESTCEARPSRGSEGAVGHTSGDADAQRRSSSSRCRRDAARKASQAASSTNAQSGSVVASPPGSCVSEPGLAPRPAALKVKSSTSCRSSHTRAWRSLRPRSLPASPRRRSQARSWPSSSSMRRRWRFDSDARAVTPSMLEARPLARTLNFCCISCNISAISRTLSSREGPRSGGFVAKKTRRRTSRCTRGASSRSVALYSSTGLASEASCALVPAPSRISGASTPSESKAVDSSRRGSDPP